MLAYLLTEKLFAFHMLMEVQTPPNHEAIMNYMEQEEVREIFLFIWLIIFSFIEHVLIGHRMAMLLSISVEQSK